ncbi:polysaccharide deacetylase family protein [Candidatus Venteria ishoeyi]|uniref:Polysaccharide deacetylase n=1 Tax=Candidatus Venteria ishoeyi TaxID=1899563 RepID=A0A1H6F8R4_9GAMM|nr:polysaccharide deacetylase family protein [Candidatus Venteria ishoeyi]SEH06518.1 Polysaccharide deacetylase [Candidatus Venteria ishoeyi]
MAAKGKIQSLMGRFSEYIPLKLLIKISRQKLILPFYHSVSDNYLPHLSNLYKAKTSHEFEKDLDFLLQHFNPVDLHYVKNNSERGITDPVFHLSFDDGLSELKSIIAPILKRKGIPATIFINSAFIDNKALFYRYKASLLIDAIKSKSFSKIENQEIEKVLGISETSLAATTNTLLRINYQQQEILEKIASIVKIDFDAYLKKKNPYLTSQEIIDLQQQGHSIAAHSIDHPEFRFLELEEQIRQVNESLQFVKSNFNPPIHSFSFPFTDYGVGNDFFRELEKLNICDISFGCAGLKLDSVIQHFQRIAFENEQHSAEQTLKYEYFYFILKSLIVKNKIRRT